MSEDAIARLRALLERHCAIVEAGDLPGHVECDAAFHATIRDRAANLRLSRQLEQIDQQLRVLNSRLSRRAGWSGREVLADHRAILEALAAHNPDAAKRRLRAHIERSRAFHLRSSPAAP